MGEVGLLRRYKGRTIERLEVVETGGGGHGVGS